MLSIGLAAALVCTDARAAEDDWEFELEGYYRTRGYTFRNLYPDQEEPARVMVQRLRLQPQLDFEGRAKFIMMADVLDNVAWGDNQSLASTSLFAGDPSTTGNFRLDDGVATDTFRLKRAWMEFKVPVGLLRVGRQESNWGMGLLSNNGNGFDDSFGENNMGSTFDRAIFATKPIAILQTIMGRDDSGIPLFFAIGVDRLVEDPLFQYYGYSCDDENASGDLIIEGDEEYDARCDPNGEGYHTLAHDYVNDERLDSERQGDWWIDNADDVYEVVYVLIYKGEGITLAGSAADLILGTYVVNRKQEETDSNILILDAYAKFLWKGIYLEGEVLNIRGQTSAIALPGAYDPASESSDPLYKEADIWGYVARVGYKRELYDVVMEYGYASGDDDPADAAFTGRPLHSDYNVGLLIFEEIMARVTRETWTEDAAGLWSNGGVYNATYIFPSVSWRPMKNWEVTGAYLLAWPNRPDGSRILCDTLDEEALEDFTCNDPQDGLPQEIGWEFDLGVKHRFHEHVLFAMEGGYAQVSPRVPLETVGLNPEGKFFTLQTRIAYEF